MLIHAIFENVQNYTQESFIFENLQSYAHESASLSGAPGLHDWESQLESMCYTTSITTVKLFYYGTTI